MANTIYGMTNYYSFFSSPIKSYDVNPVTNLIYGSTASKVYAQTFAKKSQSTMSSYLSALNSNIVDLKTSAKPLSAKGPDSSFNSKSVLFSDDSSVEGFAAFNADEDQYTLNISKLATVQSNKGRALDSTASTSFNMGLNTFSLKSGNIEKNISFNVDIDERNKSSLNKMAAAINNSRVGVTASVISNSSEGTSYLSLVSDKTGTESSFSIMDVNGNAVSASGADTVTTSAQNSEYSVNGEQYTSQDNTVDLDNGKVQVTFIKADSKDINLTVGTDLNGIISDIKKFADTFNSTVNFASSYTGKLEGADKLKEELGRIVDFRKSSLQSIGVSITESGTLSVDENKLEKALSSNFSSVKSVFEGYSGIAEKVYAKANEVLSSPLKYSKPSDLGRSYNSFYNYMTAVNRSIVPQNIYSGMVLDMFL